MPITASAAANGSQVNQIINKVDKVTKKWFSLQNNKLDGSFYPIPMNGAEEVGYISAQKSNADGTLTTAVSIKITELSLFTSSFQIESYLHGAILKDFVVKAYRNSPVKTAIVDATVTNNTKQVWKINFNSLQEINEIELTVTKLSAANKSVWITELGSLFEVVRSDLLTPKIVETNALSLGIYANDSLLTKIGENRGSVQAALISADTLLGRIAESPGLIQINLARPDILALRVSESKQITAQFVSTDNLKAIIGNVKAITASLATIDTLRLKITENPGVVRANLTSHDVLLAALQNESFFTQYEMWTSDNLLAKLDASKQIIARFSSIDSLNSKIDNVKAITAGLTKADILMTNINENHGSVQANLTRVDILLSKISESPGLLQAHLIRPDILLAKINESKQIIARFSSIDSLNSKIDNTKAITAKLSKPDTLNLSSNLEADNLTAEFGSSDLLKPILIDESLMRNIHTVMCADERQVFCKVEITYTNPYLDADTTFESTGTAYNTNIEQLADSIDESKYKWFNLHDNKLDGSYHPIDSKYLYPVGWWSNRLSDTSGVFSVPVEVVVTFSKRPLSILKVDGDDKLNCYPVDFTLTLYDESDVLLHTEIVTGNTKVHWIKTITQVDNAVKLKLSVSKINQANSALKLTELFTSVKELYSADELISVDLLEEVTYQAGQVTLGAISSNEVDIVIDNTDDLFTIGNTQSKLHGKLKKNRRVRIWFGAEVEEGVIEWYEYGTYWTTDWNVPYGSMVAYTTARDRLNLLAGTNFITSQVYLNKSLYQLFEIVLGDAGLNADEYVIDVSLRDIVIPYAWFDKMTHKEALQKLAGCVIVNIFCDRQGRIIVTAANPTPNVMAELRDDFNIYDKDFPSAWADLTNYVEVKSHKIEVGSTQSIFISEEVITVPPNSKLPLTFVFNESPCMDISLPTIVADGITYEKYNSYCWGFEITLINNNVTAKDVTSIQINGKILKQSTGTIAIAQDSSAILNDGKISTNIESPFVQTTVYAHTLANNLLNMYKNARHDVDIQGRGDIALRLLDRVKVDTFDTDTDYKIKRQNIHWDGTLEVRTEAVKI